MIYRVSEIHAGPQTNPIVTTCGVVITYVGHKLINQGPFYPFFDDKKT